MPPLTAICYVALNLPMCLQSVRLTSSSERVERRPHYQKAQGVRKPEMSPRKADISYVNRAQVKLVDSHEPGRLSSGYPRGMPAAMEVVAGREGGPDYHELAALATDPSCVPDKDRN